MPDKMTGIGDETVVTQMKRPRAKARGPSIAAGEPAADATGHVCVMSTSLVSGRKISATTKLIAATAIGYHRPE